MASLKQDEQTLQLDLPVLAPDITLRCPAASISTVHVNDKPLHRATKRAEFDSGTYLVEDDGVLIAFDPVNRQHTIEWQ
ncbi:MAG: hypothetical protein QGG05_01035 [Candidatus Latescibacteria bacterium]|nr:hypothetical protein [Candidatus Latescibacterota bacterium]